MIEITRDEAEALKEFIKYDLIDAVRNNLDDDYCIEWLANICRIYDKCLSALEEAEHEEDL